MFDIKSTSYIKKTDNLCFHAMQTSSNANKFALQTSLHQYQSSSFNIGEASETRTHTLKTLPPEDSASTNSAIAPN